MADRDLSTYRIMASHIITTNKLVHVPISMKWDGFYKGIIIMNFVDIDLK